MHPHAMSVDRHAFQIAAVIKSELILRLAYRSPHLSERDVERVVNTILARISDALVNGDRVELRGLGSFRVTERGARIARNPRTGATVSVENRILPQFKLGRAMQARMNPLGTVTVTDLDNEVERLLQASLGDPSNIAATAPLPDLITG